METAIRWSPNSTLSEQTFLVADVNGRTLKHYRVEKYDGRELRYDLLSIQRKVAPFRAFDWSPNDENVVAIGQWSGEATVLRLNDESLPLSLPVKHQRLCNAVAFGQNALLATGLERVRNDFCLNIWDINRTAATTSSPVSSRPGSRRQIVEPFRQFASSEAITSIKFFSQPDILVTGVKGNCLRIYDLRENTGTPVWQLNTLCVHNLAIDWLDENYFASAAPTKDSTIQIWDRRAGIASTGGTLGSGESIHQGPVISYKRPFDLGDASSQDSIWSLKYCKSRSGFLGALASTGTCKVFETKKSYIPSSTSTEPYTLPDCEDFDMTPQIMSTKRIHNIKSSTKVRGTNGEEASQIASFDFSNLGGPHGRPCAIIMRADQNIDITELDAPPPALSISPLGSLAIGRSGGVEVDNEAADVPVQLGALLTVLSPDDESLDSPELFESNDYESRTSERVRDDSSERRSSRNNGYNHCMPSSKLTSIHKALLQLTVSRRRCFAGYLFNCKKNAQIVSSDPQLQEMWSWIARAKGNAADQGMVAQSIDFSYMGVSDIWNYDLGSQRANRIAGKAPVSIDVADAVASLAKSLQLPDSLVKTSPTTLQRKLCLHTCGFGLSYQELDAEVNDLVHRNMNTKAALLAVIHDQFKLAFESLRTGKASSMYRELSLALAGFVKGRNDDTWDETVRDIAKELKDPYARAILAFVSYGDWHDVLAETSLPLKYKVAVALMHLDDADLTTFLESATAESIEKGDIRGIVLTGLTEKIVPLFHAYLLRFLDLQTPTLALSFVCPRYFSDPLIDIWRESYRSLLNTYRLFVQRVQFDVQATKLSIRSSGRDAKPSLAPAPRQVSLRCNYCDQALDRNSEHAPPSSPGAQPDANPPSINTQPTSIFGDAKSGTVCPKCGRHMPRCIICMMWLGTPISYPPANSGGLRTKPPNMPQSPKPTKAKTVGVAQGTKELKAAQDIMQDFTTVCRRCWHMSHTSHSQEWFEKHDICAVPGCQCRCAELDS